MLRDQSFCAPNFARKSAGNLLRRAVLETLEGRTMMSSSVTFASGLLTVTGDPVKASSLTVNLTSGSSTINASADQGHTLSVALSSVKQIRIVGGAGGDSVYIDQRITAPATIIGGEGNDQIRGGGGINTITDGNGNNWISGRGTANSIKSGNGNSTLLGAAGNDTLVAGNGQNSIDGAGANDSITVGNGNDTITGGAGNDTIVAGNGQDILNGGLGDDRIVVGTGKSTIIPGSGINSIQAGSTSATIVPSSGKNTVVYATASNSSGGSTSGGSTSGGSTSGGSTGSGVNPTGDIAQTPGGTWATYSAAAPSGTNPQAVMQVLSTSFTTGIAVVVRGVNSKLGTGSPIDANYQWNFGDGSGEYNTLTGFNAAHVYTTAGSYKVTLTVTNSLRQTSSVSTTLVITPETRQAIYVDSINGNDANNGLSTSKPIKTAARAGALLADNTEIFFMRGETFNLAGTLKLNHTNVLVGAYGSGAQPIINFTTLVSGAVIFSTNSSSAIGVTIQDLTFTTLNGTQPSVANQPMAVMVGGFNTAVLRCTFKDVEYDINASGSPVGLTIFDNSSPNSDGLQGYFLWDQGVDTTLVGNYVNGSVHEHIVRTSSASEILAYNNNFNNFDGKGCIEIHVGSFAWIDSNTVNSGDIRVGPLGLWGEPITSTTAMCVVQNNHVINSFISVQPGTNSVSIRSNIIQRDGAQMIDIQGQDGLGRQSSDIRILNNTGISNSDRGNFLKVESHINGILLENNLLIQPKLAVGGYTTAPVYVNEADMSSFTYISGNVWQLPSTFYSYAHGGINYMGATYTATGYMTDTVWNALAQVGKDYFYNVTINSAFAPGTGSAAASASAAVAGVFTDYYGNPRNATGTWSAGAIAA